ncbi:MAG: Uma2 family endonuclease [Candidatus Xenobia bacterium]
MSLAEQRLTEEEYLAIERQAETKSEFFNGRMYAMSGVTEAHDLICTNVRSELRQQLKGRNCRVYSSDMKVRVNRTGLYTYPDASVLCGDAAFLDDRHDVLLNPSTIVEVLSESTERYDRGDKFQHYQNVPTVREYVLIGQKHVRVELFTRQSEGKWLLTVLDKLSDVLVLESVQASIPLAEIYDKVEVTASDTPDHPSEPG